MARLIPPGGAAALGWSRLAAVIVLIQFAVILLCGILFLVIPTS